MFSRESRGQVFDSSSGSKTCPAVLVPIVTPRHIAERLNMSTHYLADYLRTQTRQNTQQHIHAFLIDRAKHLLLTTDSSASEIAYQLGFEYPQHFTRLFKRKTGMTPQEFRRAG